MRNLFYCILALALLAAAAGCGQTSTQTDQYAETIYWEEQPSTYAADELSDSELDAQDSSDEAASDSDSAATPDSTESTAPEKKPEKEPEKHGASVTAGEPILPEGVRPGRIPLRRIGRLHELFNDSNHYQLEHAKRLGIEPITGISSYYNTRRPIVKIETCKDFVVDELKHSYPYLVPEAAQLLHDIGRGFQDSLRSRHAGHYRIIVTSVLRTPSTVKRLRRVNGNATQESTHQYGTTFDITYTRFDATDGREINTQEDLKNLLGEVIYDLHRRGRCMVKYERKSPCFHITVVE